MEYLGPLSGNSHGAYCNTEGQGTPFTNRQSEVLMGARLACPQHLC